MNFSVVHQDKYSRGLLILRLLFGSIYIALPHAFLLMFVGIAAAVLQFIAFWVTLFTGKYPEGMFTFQVNYMRWQMRADGSLANLFDAYPAFGLNAPAENVTLDIPRPDKLNQIMVLIRVLFGSIYVGIPHGFLLIFRTIAMLAVGFVAWWAILFTGKYPPKMHEFVVGTCRWLIRVQMYLGFMTDTYPPFNGKP